MPKFLLSFGTDLRVIIVGASGGIGRALTQALAASNQTASIHAFSRFGVVPENTKITAHRLDFTKDADLEKITETLKPLGPFDICIVATGLLQGEGIAPEKNMRALNMEAMQTSFAVNCFGPTLTAKHFLPLMARDRKVVFGALSARVGSISDNRLGGWHAYRASKAALNMMIKNLAIEQGRRFQHMVILGLHPGTVDTDLSKPFQKNVPNGKLFTPEYSAEKLLNVIDGATPQDSGSLLAWDGQTIPF